MMHKKMSISKAFSVSFFPNMSKNLFRLLFSVNWSKKVFFCLLSRKFGLNIGALI